MTVNTTWPSTLAIVDDDSVAALSTSVAIEDAGFTPVVLHAGFETVEQALSEIEQRAEGALCDHRLSPLGFAQFTGAELVAALYRRRLPAVLTTQFVMDADVSIRRWRSEIPELVVREHLDPETIRAAMARCLAELGGAFGPGRTPSRVLIRILDVNRESEEDVVDGLVPSWRAQEAVRFPLDLVPHAIREGIAPGTRLFAEVNIGAEANQDLYFANFEEAPPAEGDDEFSDIVDT